MGIFKRIFNKTKEKVAPITLNSKEKWCKNIVDSKRGKYHKDNGKKVWAYLYDITTRKDEYGWCTILTFYSSYEPDGTRSVFIVEDENGRYNEVNNYLLDEPHDWYYDIDYWKQMDYRNVQKNLIEYKKLCGVIPTDSEYVSILKKEQKLLGFKPILTKSELREKRLGRILD